MSGDGESKIEKTDEEWRRELTPEQYQITRQAGTEPAFSGKYNDSKDPGTFHCVCCDTPCSIRVKNSIPARDGRVSGSL